MKIIKISSSIPSKESIRNIKSDIHELDRLMGNIIDGIYKESSHKTIKSVFSFQFSQLVMKLNNVIQVLELDFNTRNYMNQSIGDLSEMAKYVQGLTTFDENIVNAARKGKSILAKIKFILDLQG